MSSSRTVEQSYAELKQLVAETPNLLTCDVHDPGVQRWLSKAYLSVEAVSGLADAIQIKVASDNLDGAIRKMNAQAIIGCLSRALYRVEAQLPASNGNAFVQTGDLWGAFVSVSNLFGQAKNDLFVIDPFLDDSVLRDYADYLNAGVGLRLLTTKRANHFARLLPALQKWNATHADRQVSLRALSDGTIHDRVICVDNRDAWIVTQSLKQLGVKAPATVMRFDDELSTFKIAAYEALWGQGEPVPQ